MSADDKAAAAWNDYVSQQQEEKIEELERQLNAANSEIERLRKANLQLREGAEEQKQRIKWLEEAGDAVAAIIGPPGSAHWADENQVDAAWNNWRKAKEAKP